MKKLILLLSLLHFFSSEGQNTDVDVFDTAKRLTPFSGNIEELHRNFEFKNATDSSMVYLQQYDRIRKQHIGIQNLGEIGTPYINQLFNPREESGFNSGLNIFGDMYYRTTGTKHYNAKVPFSMFSYAQGNAGQRGMINFEALHTQNIGENFNISLQYHSISYDGFYNKQTITNKHIQVSSYYRSKNKRYLLSLYFNWNKNNQLENGGIEQSAANDTFFRSLGPTVRFVEVGLNNAKNINRLREHTLKQTYWLTMPSDSSNRIGLSHTFSAFRQSNYYTDLSTDYSFYQNVYNYNSSYSSDTTGINIYSNTIEIFNPLKTKGLSYNAGAKYDYIQYLEKADAGNFYSMIAHNLSIHGKFDFSFLSKFKSSAQGQLYLSGYNSGDYSMEWSNSTSIIESRKIEMTGKIFTSSRHPHHRDIRKLGNHYNWNNSFSNINTKGLSAGIQKYNTYKKDNSAFKYSLPSKVFEWLVNYYLIDNFIYYDQDGLPKQGNKGQNCLQSTLYTHINLRHFQLDQNLLFQTFSNSLESMVLLPTLVSKSSLYYQGYAFKKATFVQIGFDAYISNSYKARFYNPGTMQFQLSDKSVGAYPFVDFFINAEIKTARIFFKMEHINQDIPNPYTFSNYLYTSPYQPSSPRRFRIGFVWKFFY